MTKLLLSVVIAVGVILTSSFDFNKLSDDQTVKYNTEYVIVLIIDGPRFTETFGDSTYQYIPHLGNELKREGVLLTNFRNNGPTYTISGHSAIKRVGINISLTQENNYRNTLLCFNITSNKKGFQNQIHGSFQVKGN
jgi:hypothetical protein